MTREKHYEIRIYLDNIHDLFTTPTDDPFSEKVRFVSGIEFIKSEFRPQLLRRGVRTRTTILLPRENLEPDLVNKTKAALARYCQFKIQQNRNAITVLRWDALKSLLVGIIAPRLEETFELVRERLEASGFDKIAGRRVVLTGGASQLPGIRELAGLILDKQVRIGRPSRLEGLAEATQGPAFATTAGLIHFALSERAEIPRRGRALTEESNGLFGRLGNWVREYL